MTRALPLLVALVAAPAPALDLAMPRPAAITFSETRAPASHRLPTGPWTGSVPFETVEGAVTRRTWQLAAAEATTLELLMPLRDQLADDGWTVTFQCETAGCGGFDFRFDIDVTPAPEMFVDLADYRFLTAAKGGQRADLLVSRSGDMGYVQLTAVDPDGDAVIKSASNAASGGLSSAQASALTAALSSAIEAGDLVGDLTRTGRAVLTDLDFATGSTELPGRDYASLAALAGFLRERPAATVALVGHTDAEGGAEGNMAISRRRADAARRLLVDVHGIDPARIETHGVGFFAPMAANDTEAGRAVNRRVEAVVTSTP